MLRYGKLLERVPTKEALKDYFIEVDQLMPPNKFMCDKMVDLATEVLSLDPDYATTSSHFRGVRDSKAYLFL